ncbi:MAG TPA: hypothetical protein PLX02_05075 [Syntrophorhabdaceae bacterium]|nr:hypothetical protein [Syntrophorhabdaceae bacterium]HQM80976.1 hypothetical protein [Syntrophorhabdaceae bacterium]
MKKIFILLFIMLLAFSGCAMFKGSKAADESAQPGQEALNQAFYGFPDIPVPQELAYVPENSFIYESPSMRAGVMFFNGNVEMQSLENYFKINMAKNGWRYINSFRYKDVVLNYQKENKTCNIKMSRGAFQTEVQIWVGPADQIAPQKGNAPK